MCLSSTLNTKPTTDQTRFVVLKVARVSLPLHKKYVTISSPMFFSTMHMHVRLHGLFVGPLSRYYNIRLKREMPRFVSVFLFDSLSRLPAAAADVFIGPSHPTRSSVILYIQFLGPSNVMSHIRPCSLISPSKFYGLADYNAYGNN
jgi:hypothetical protein